MQKPAFIIINSFYQLSITVYYILYFLYGLLTTKLFFRFDLQTKLGFTFRNIVKKKLSKQKIPDTTKLTQQKSKSNDLTISSDTPPLIWIHAVSAGEVKLAQKIIQYFYPPSEFFGKFLITYCSTTGHSLAKQLFNDDERVITSHMLIDVWWLSKYMVKVLNQYFRLLKFIVIEHDLWPNLLKTLKKRAVERVVVNFFLKPSDYRNYRLCPPAFHFVHQVDYMVVQNEETMKQLNRFQPFISINNIIVGGNLKYGSSDTFKKKDNHSKKKGLVLCLGSSHKGEEELLIKKVAPFLDSRECKLFIIIPRHPERGLEIATFTKKNYPHLSTIQYSKYQEMINFNYLNMFKGEKTVMIVDKIGLSEILYTLSDIIMIGDSFIPSNGGHNFVEAIALHKPVVYGQYMMSYSDITPLLEDSKGVIRSSNNDITDILSRLIKDKKYRTEVAKRGFALLEHISFDKKSYAKVLDIKEI